MADVAIVNPRSNKVYSLVCVIRIEISYIVQEMNVVLSFNFVGDDVNSVMYPLII